MSSELSREEIAEWLRFGDNTDMPEEEHESWRAMCRMAEAWRAHRGRPVGGNGGRVAWSDALLIIQRGFDSYKERHPKWWKCMNGTPILNDLPCVIAEAVSAELHYPQHAAPTGDTVQVPREPTEEMIRVGAGTIVAGLGRTWTDTELANLVYRAMLSAAPKEP